jgi:ADP-ribose pyrophosphatase
MKILSNHKNTSKIDEVKMDGKKLFSKLYIDRVQERLKDALKNYEIGELEEKQSIIVNGKKCVSLQKSFSSVVENPIFRSILERGQKPVFFHGDLHFENILIKQNSVLKIVDPNGAECGLISYDYGKLLHSALGKYSLIQDFRFILKEVTSEQWLLEIQETEEHRIISQKVIKKMKAQLNNLEFLQALFACWCHMIALIPHHIANGKQQHIAFYLRALEIGRIFCETLNNYGAWKTVSQKNIFDNKRMVIREDVVQLPDGADGYYTVWDTCRAVAIVAIDSGRVLLKREYRHPVNSVIYDLPGGGVETKENVLDAAARELYEETGYVSETLRVVGSFYMDPGRSNREIFIVLAENVKIKKDAEKRTFIENDAFIHYGFFDISEVLSMIKKGEIKDNSLITGMFFVMQEIV